MKKRKPMSAETKLKIKRALLGRKHSLSARKKMSTAHKGRSHSEATRRKISSTMTGFTRGSYIKKEPSLPAKQKVNPVAFLPDGSPIKYWDENGLHCYDSNGTLIK